MCRVACCSTLIALVLCSLPSLSAQSAPPLEFDVVSIKRNDGGLDQGAGIRRLPDGTFIMTNQPIASIINTVSPETVLLRNVVGAPDWFMRERYDITIKPPAGATREQMSEMWKRMFADRMKLVAHLEHREQTTLALMLERSDGRLGPQLKPSTLDCAQPEGGAAPQPPASSADFEKRCGFAGSANSMMSGGITMDRLAQVLSGRAGSPVANRTGLAGYYAFKLTFSAGRGNASPDATPAVDDAPEFFTALREQLGLKLQPEKTMVPFLVIEHIDRPSPN